MFQTARPSAPRNCSLQAGNNSNEGTSSWLRVRCVAGYDGGLPQYFVLEALDPITGKTRFNGSVNETGKLQKLPKCIYLLASCQKISVKLYFQTAWLHLS